jgi:hypothetical protein
MNSVFLCLLIPLPQNSLMNSIFCLNHPATTTLFDRFSELIYPKH